jgi:seryl-tRNA synthetase
MFDKIQLEIRKIGNLLNENVIISDNEDNNKVVKTWGEIPDKKITQVPGSCYHHQVL